MKKSDSVDVGSITVRVEIKLPIEGIQYSSTTTEVSVTRSDKDVALSELDFAIDHIVAKMNMIPNEKTIQDKVNAAVAEQTAKSTTELQSMQSRVNQANSILQKLSADPRTKMVLAEYAQKPKQ